MTRWPTGMEFATGMTTEELAASPVARLSPRPMCGARVTGTGENRSTDPVLRYCFLAASHAGPHLARLRGNVFHRWAP
jgi:hypothetical protein